MHNRVVKTSNVERFLTGVAAVGDRGAPEASMMLVDGDVSRTRFPWTQNWLNRSVQGGPEHDR